MTTIDLTSIYPLLGKEWWIKKFESCRTYVFILFIAVKNEEKGFRLLNNLEALKIIPEYQFFFPLRQNVSSARIIKPWFWFCEICTCINKEIKKKSSKKNYNLKLCAKVSI